MELRDSARLGIPREGVRGALSLLRRNRDFRGLYIAQLVSYGGDWFLTVALFGLVLDTTHSPLMASLVLVSQMVPFFLLSPLGGVLADRLNRQRLMVSADLVRALACFGFLFVHDRSDVWIAFVLQAGLAGFGALFDPASSAAVPNLVDEEDLGTANVLVGSAWGTMLAIGAALGGLVAAVFGRTAAFMGDAASFAISAGLLSTIHRPFSEAREKGTHEGFVRATLETFEYARRDRRVLALISVKGGFGFASGVIVLLSVFAHDVFHAGDVGIGVLFGARGLGALIGPFFGRALAGPSERGLFRALGLALTTYGVFYSVFGLMPALWLAAPFAVGAHLGGGAQWTLSTYGLQRIVPDYIRGRVFAFDFAFVTLSITVSNLVAGWSAERFGPRPTMVGLAIVAAAYAGIWWTATRRVRARLDTDRPPG
ncbi:MAG: MFS transporter [Actinomycetota bacterium]